MNALLIVAHGSRVEESNQEIRVLAEQVAQIDNTGFGAVQCAFLELAAPSIVEGLTMLVEQGASRVCVMPYFLSRGKHVQRDVPSEVAIVRDRHPGIDIVISPYIGLADQMPSLVLSQALRAGGGADDAC